MPVSASANWLALQKVLPTKPKRANSSNESFPRKRRKTEHEEERDREPDVAPVKVNTTQKMPQANTTRMPPPDSESTGAEFKNGESPPALRKMIFGNMEYTEAQKQPGKFLALDCEMVGVGPEGAESSLARVSLVNYYGAVQLDAFVRQRERVVDYRTEFSGVRETDMIHARPFDEIQKQVAALLKDRVLVGHAVFNDLKVLLLSHPRPQTRDTQYYAGKFKVAKSKYVALRTLVKQELDATIQGGEHSSVTDARATMAVYRLHRREWEKGSAPLIIAAVSKKKKGKRRAEESDDDNDDEDEEEEKAATKPTKTKSEPSFPGGGRKGVSSGLSTVVRRGAGASTGKSGGGGERIKAQWWTELGSGGGAKGSMRL